MDSLEATEKECAEGRTAPRVSLADIEGNIKETHYATGDQLHEGDEVCEPLTLLTLCIAVTENGFTVVGKSACASPENFDAELGKKLAYEDAVRQLWPLMGYALRERLHKETTNG